MLQAVPCAKSLQECTDKLLRPRLPLSVRTENERELIRHIQLFKHWPGTFHFSTYFGNLGITIRPDAAKSGRPSLAGGGPAISGPRDASTISFRGANQSGQFGVAKFLEQSPDIPVNGFLPQVLAGLQVPAHRSDGDPGISRGTVESE